MSRPLRIEYPGAFYHITARGNAKQDIFLDKIDYRKFLELLGRESEQQRWNCYSYCLMNNHYHLLIETLEPNLSKGMRRLNGTYTQYFNKRHNRVGHLFQGRYKAIIVDKDSYLLQLNRYIALNPVRAGKVNDPVDWEWSSHKVIIENSDFPKWYNREILLRLFGKSYKEAVIKYRSFVNDGLDSKSPWTNLKGQIWLGDEEFIVKVKSYFNEKQTKNIPTEQIRPIRPTEQEITNKISEIYNIKATDLYNRKNKEAYKACVYLLRRVANLPISEVVAMFKISESRVSQIQKEIENEKSLPVKLQKLVKNYKLKN